MLCDISKVHSGYGIMPKVIGCTDDENWGQAGSTKKIYVAKSISQNGGFASVDRVIERVENEYWKIEVSEFQFWMFGCYKFVGGWNTKELEENKIQIDYSYTLYSSNLIWYPLIWVFTHVFWRKYMKRVLENIRIMVTNEEPYLYK